MQERQISQCQDLLLNVFKEDALGLYLYGSSVVGGLQNYSDIDLLLVLSRQATNNEKAFVCKQLLNLSQPPGHDTARPIELTVVVQSRVTPWQYPPVADFQFGEWLRDDFITGLYTESAEIAMPDLAIIFTQVLLASEVLHGAAAETVLPQVPYRDFVRALTDEQASWLANLQSDTRNVLLALARMWHTLATSSICSKTHAANWALARLPERWHLPLKRAYAICLGQQDEQWDDAADLIKPCADHMVNQINVLTEKRLRADTSQKITIEKE